jgi:quinol monooxygenase YgiN
MYGLIVKMAMICGRREEMIEILKESASNMAGCLSYVVAKDSADEDVL